MVYMIIENKEGEKNYWEAWRAALESLKERRGFCPTGEGGGIDNSCGGKGAGGGERRTPSRPPSKREVQLASQEGASEKQVAARKVVAAHFMHSRGSYLDRETGKLKPLDRPRFEGQMKAIDWTKPVTVGPPPTLPPPARMVQWQAPGNIPPSGGYFSTPDSTPEQLGIGRRGTAWKLDGQPVVDKVPHEFDVKGTPQYLQSTAAPAVDTWSTKDKAAQAANGGGPQWFVPDAQATGKSNKFVLVGQKKTRRSALKKKTEARSITLSIDFDRTFSKEPKLWGEFAKQAKAEGNTVVMISRREDTDKNRSEVSKKLGKYASAFDKVMLVGKTTKDAAAKKAGIKVDVWVDDSPQYIRSTGSRAFCPGASPPDNSCSPSNKGTGSPAPAPPAPDPSRVDPNDPRGRSGHTAEQRRAYGIQVEEWLLKEHGISLYNYGRDEFSVDELIQSPPSMDAFETLVNGIERLDALGMTKPKDVFFDDMLPQSAAASYEYWSGKVNINPNADRIRMELAIQLGAFAGTSADDLLVHEMSHHDHFEHMKKNFPSSFQGKDKEAVANAAMNRVGVMFGVPDDDGIPTADPWTRSGRITASTLNADGKPLDPDEARDIASEVSQYAMTNPLEFVAEVRTGVSAGADYSQEVMSLYNDYMGPPLARPGTKRKKAA